MTARTAASVRRLLFAASNITAGVTLALLIFDPTRDLVPVGALVTGSCACVGMAWVIAGRKDRKE